jgi:zinc transporter ZupT
LVDAPSIALGILGTAVPFYLALTLFHVQAIRRHAQVVLALATGMSIYFLLDGFVDSAELGVTIGYGSGWQPLELIAAFALTFVILQSLRRKPEYSWPLWVVALGISIHSFAEAHDLASAANLYFSSLSTVLPSAVSFLLHKFLEGFALVAAAAVTGAKGLRQVMLAGTPMLVIAVVGSLASLATFDLSPIIAAGVGGWALVTLVLATHFERPSRPTVFTIIAIGFIIVYAASLLHYTGVVQGP